MAYAYNLSAFWEAKVGRLLEPGGSRLAWAKKQDLISIKKNIKNYSGAVMWACSSTNSYLGGWGVGIDWAQELEATVSYDRAPALESG